MNNRKKYPLWNNDRIKYLWDKKTLRIGSDDVDVTEIHGLPQFWIYFISLCNGRNEINEIYKELKENCALEKQHFLNFINQFEKKNFIDILDKAYRQTDYNIFFESPSTYFSSEGLGGKKIIEKLQKMKVIILGCGGGGSHIALQLAQFGVGKIHLVDDDKVELKTINRQSLFHHKDIGKYKVEVTKQFIEERNSYWKSQYQRIKYYLKMIYFMN
ncbi:ThiF family adenylyltransferase [Streptococcus didelphis]|uniref:ThiF family adenylyltransferase n=1 Tax=Streptococcus didelphis TaxID=102886 RepID=A0ABY9LI25_9STRE|nr:ThiF family adenylyltransferase [Streptococcus didelphis]WMB28502.1 ThiF family adenylyltransferase [Streptococcus didelphis]WMB29178.1 ThiF family adenylyltransferase [Streptococcus didelphis]